MDNQVIQATLGIRQGQKTKKVKKNTTQTTETNEQHIPHKKPRRNPGVKKHKAKAMFPLG
jgi:hypothetical protein